MIQQGRGVAQGREAILWIERPNASQQHDTQVVVYLEGDVKIMADRQARGTSLQDRVWLGRFQSTGQVQVTAPAVAGMPDVLPPIYWRAVERRKPSDADGQWHSRVEAAQYTVPTAQPMESIPAGIPVGPVAAPTPGIVDYPAASVPKMRRIQVYPRSDPPTLQVSGWSLDPTGNRVIATVNGGVNIVIETEGAVQGLGQIGTIDISTDRMVIWTSAVQPADLKGNDRIVQDERVPLELYMEGNIVFRQGDRIIHADRMYYDVTNKVGTILNAEMLTPVLNYDGKLRLQADVIQQTAEGRYSAENAFITSSRFGEPGYRLQSSNIYFEDIQVPAVDPITGQSVIEHQKLATANNDFLFVGPVPIFYWPTISTDLEDSTYYIRALGLKQDKVYGTQILSKWSGYDLLGIRNRPVGTDLDIKLDYLSKRGFGHGGDFTYGRDDFFFIDGPTAGLLSYWGIQDGGRDNLGNLRNNLVPERSYRERLFWQHRQMLFGDFQVTAEAGWISDRNFLEEYYKREWEELKDETTDVELKRITENRSWSLLAGARINDFFSQTEWLPRFDHYWLGQPLLNNTFTWYEHSNLAYARFQRLDAPTNPNDQPFSYLPWETGSFAGERFSTRQEIDYPFQIGVVKVVPFVMGEASHWGEDINGQPLDRLWGEVGIRTSLPMSYVDPTVSSELFNVHGLAHKVVFKAQFTASDANRDLTDLPLYDALDDDSVEAAWRHFITTTFGWPSTIPPTVGVIPGKFDPRLYALRYGLQDWTTSPSTEIAGDLMALRLGAEQRWQTKRGPFNNPHILDWMALDTNISFFPNANRDNYGTAAGLADYNYRWHVGDRLTLVSEGIFDFFDDGQKIFSVGGFLSRPPRGSLYAGFNFLDGPIHNRILSFSYSYWMSPKWVSSFGMSVDLTKNGNLGENLTITRIGESFLISAGFNADPARNSVGVNFAIEPRFLPKTRLGNINGTQIPPAGAAGLE
jgi:hypothetical protein